MIATKDKLKLGHKHTDLVQTTEEPTLFSSSSGNKCSSYIPKHRRPFAFCIFLFLQSCLVQTRKKLLCLLYATADIPAGEFAPLLYILCKSRFFFRLKMHDSFSQSLKSRFFHATSIYASLSASHWRSPKHGMIFFFSYHNKHVS